MTDPRLAVALAFTLPWEGGYVNDPDDPGGATNKGITQKVFTAWAVERGEVILPVEHITDETVAAIYQRKYWAACGQGLPAPLDLVAFDTAVNCGVARCQEWIANSWHPTGDAKAAARNLCDARENHYRGLVARKPVMAKFLNGWLNRLTALRVAAGIR